LHTDTWDHPAAVAVYERAGFRVFAVRREPVDPL
jgi:RimJ/RimL family protein N-acetyltransferase